MHEHYNEGKLDIQYEYDYNDEYLSEEKSIKGKIYDKYHDLIYEGDILNGKRNGKGKDLLYGILLFEGEYLNDKRNGMGKEYSKGKIIFERKYLNVKDGVEKE